MTVEVQIESYLTALRLHLGSLTIVEREDKFQHRLQPYKHLVGWFAT